MKKTKISKALQAPWGGPSHGAGTVWSQFSTVDIYYPIPRLIYFIFLNNQGLFTIYDEPKPINAQNKIEKITTKNWQTNFYAKKAFSSPKPKVDKTKKSFKTIFLLFKC